MAFKFNAEVRQAQGKGASRRLRHNGQIPAIIYGGSEAPVSIILNHDELNNAQAHDSFYSDVITLVVEGKEVAVKVQAMQRHPFKPKLVHIDFKRASFLACDKNTNNDELLVFFLFGQSAVKFEIVLGVFSNEDSIRY